MLNDELNWLGCGAPIFKQEVRHDEGLTHFFPAFLYFDAMKGTEYTYQEYLETMSCSENPFFYLS